MNTSHAELRGVIAAALANGRRVTCTAPDGQQLTVQQLSKAREVPPCYLLRIGTDRLVSREVFARAADAADRMLELTTPARLHAAVMELGVKFSGVAAAG